MIYRPEIDGLRAVAVVSVILFHAGVAGFAGGLVGVDVFFVISGYLITGIIVGQRSRGTFTLRSFWARRIRRIAPALLVVMAACTPFAVLWMMPDELENFGQSLVTTLLSGNNVLLYLSSGYFDTASEFKPLMHTWSLGVEEQFYLLFPLLLLALLALGRRAAASGVVVVGLVSFGVAVWWLSTDPDAAFYLLPARSWELLVGAGLALWHERPGAEAAPRLLGPRAASAAATAGLLAIVATVVAVDGGSAVSPFVLVVPVVGAALVIAFAREGTPAARVLSRPPVVLVGLISFSAYLWHQPLFAFARIWSPEEPPVGVFLVLSVVSLALAWLTWRFVETPFRSPDTVRRRVFAPAVGSAVVLVAAAGLVLHSTNGLPGRIYEPEVLADGATDVTYVQRLIENDAERFVDDDRLNVFVVGNSFSRDLANAVLETYPEARLEIIHQPGVLGCLRDQPTPAHFDERYEAAELILYATDREYPTCVRDDLAQAVADGKEIFYGGAKNFGDNANWIARQAPDERALLTNSVPDEIVEMDHVARDLIPAEHLVPWLDLAVDGRVPITDDEGRILSPDRIHFTKYGAAYFGERVLPQTGLDEIMRSVTPED
ncbi:acyltransferase [Frigoribacterium sp. CFBP9030]|uniref:acyltransferase family protein n=1 Tax=Frigoribacterium sp. CFBP9030 TaxID=3096537 RepID=UPI002A6A5F8F|nr:acyltransferase [Frigoribacterium sp. CFBP9030]MDY0890623.1 acyltransferase [Frigoribacterium sp. CFBP9030]